MNWKGLLGSRWAGLLPIACVAAGLGVLVGVAHGFAQTRAIVMPLESAEGLKAVNVKMEPVAFKGRKALRVTDTAPVGTTDAGRLVFVTGSEFQDGVIEVDLAGDRLPDAGERARGFVGMAFRVAADGPPFECFYLRPYNGRSEDQLQRNHSAQYISIPEFPWNRLRQESPAKYESYVDLLPSEWTKVKIEVRGDTARLFVHDAPQPTLVVSHLLHGTTKGAVALFISSGSLAHFSNLRVSK